MAGVGYEPFVEWSPEALIGELEQRIELMADALDEVRGLLRSLSSARNVQTVLAPGSPSNGAAVLVREPEEAVQNERPATYIKTESVEPLVNEPVVLELEPTQVEVQNIAPVVPTRYADEPEPVPVEELLTTGAYGYTESVTEIPAPDSEDDKTRDEVRRAVEM